jgi:hypothetical protein
MTYTIKRCPFTHDLLQRIFTVDRMNSLLRWNWWYHITEMGFSKPVINGETRGFFAFWKLTPFLRRSSGEPLASRAFQDTPSLLERSSVCSRHGRSRLEPFKHGTWCLVDWWICWDFYLISWNELTWSYPFRGSLDTFMEGNSIPTSRNLYIHSLKMFMKKGEEHLTSLRECPMDRLERPSCIAQYAGHKHCSGVASSRIHPFSGVWPVYGILVLEWSQESIQMSFPENFLYIPMFTIMVNGK